MKPIIRIHGVTKQERRRIVKWTQGIGIILLIIAAIFGSDIFVSPEDEVDTYTEDEEYITSQDEEFMPLGLFDDELHFVNYVIDGDTIKVDGDIRVRLLGIDAPEKGECFYEESGNELEGLIAGEYVRLEKDVSGTDSYGRLLRYVFLPDEDPWTDDIFVNDYMLRNGYATTLLGPPNNRYQQQFVVSREQALMQETGIWGSCDMGVEGDILRQENEPPLNPDCAIKGNISEKGYGRIYLIPGCDNYNRVKIDFRKGEQYFCTEEEAQAADFRKATNCP